MAFDIRIEKATQMCCEWREYPGKPYYNAGPRLAIRNAQLSAGTTKLLNVPVGQWFHVEMSAALGERADGTWQLTVVVPGEEPKRFNSLKTASPQFKAATWLGFISAGVQNAVYCLDNVRLSNSGE